jgi:hypothetical protein
VESETRQITPVSPRDHILSSPTGRTYRVNNLTDSDNTVKTDSGDYGDREGECIVVLMAGLVTVVQPILIY